MIKVKRTTGKEKKRTGASRSGKGKELRTATVKSGSPKSAALKKKRTLISSDLFESIVDGITSGVWAADKHDVIYYANKAMEMIAGVTHQKLVGAKVLPEYAEESTRHFRVFYAEAKETLRPLYYSEVPMITPAGRQTYQSGWLIPIVRKGLFDGIICTVEDITNQKQDRKALRESEAKFRELVEGANSIIMRMNVDGTIAFFNSFAQRFFGYGEEEVIGKSVLGTIVPRTEKNMLEVRQMLRDIGRHPERYENIEYENVRKNGSRVWIAWTYRALFEDSVRLKEILCIGNDITVQKNHENLLEQCRSDLEEQVKNRTMQLTVANEELQQEINERKWMEHTLRSSEEKYRILIENANEGVVINQDGFLKYMNPKAVKIMGRQRDDLMSRHFIEFIHPDDRDVMMERYLKRLKGDSVPNYYSCRILDREGNTRWIEINSVLITWMGRPATLAFFSNITERKKAEEMMYLFDSAIRQTNDSVIITTANPVRPSSKIVYVNPAFTRMTGYTAEEVIGRPSVILQGPTEEGMEWKRFETTPSRSKSFYLETVAHRKDGSLFHIEWQIMPLRDEKGKITHFVTVQRDISERKRAEETSRAYQEQLHSLASELLLAEEQERRRIATDLHDHIGQTLAITKIKLGALKDMCMESGHDGHIDDLRALIEQTIQYTKSLTFELSPPILYELGLEATIEWLTEQMQKQHYILFYYDNDNLPKPLTRDVGILLFQTVRELFMNIVKHSQAHQVNVNIRRVQETMAIMIEDDGIGFDVSSIDKAMTFGFFSIRERLKYLGGTIDIDSRPGQGTKIVVTCPLASEAALTKAPA